MFRSILTALLAVAVMAGCATPPTMRDAVEVSADTRIAFGSVEVVVDGEQEKWGTKFTGHNWFYLTILPPDTSEAVTYRLAKDGVFYWPLEPGDYLLLGYHWQDVPMKRTGRIGASFTVPEAGGDVYLGTLVLHGNIVALVPQLEDRFDEVVAQYNERFPARAETPVKMLFRPPETVGHVAAFRGPCHADWQIDCDKRFQGLVPLAPEVATSGFPTAESLRPEFRWRACPKRKVAYDLILYEAAAYAIGAQPAASYMKGRIVAYVEGLEEPRWQPDEPLKPGTRYIWSVRMREGGTVSGWSTQSHSTFLLVYSSWGTGQWFQFKTA